MPGAPQNFPYPDFRAFRAAERSGLAELSIDPAVALKWILGKTSPTEVKVDVRHYRMGPFVAIATTVAFGVLADPRVLLSLPVFVLTLRAFAPPPSRRSVLQELSPGLYLVFAASVIIGWLFSLWWLTLIGAAQAVAGWTNFTKYQIAVRELKKAALANEPLFLSLWNDGASQVIGLDGKGYSRDAVDVVDPRQFPPWRKAGRKPTADSR